MVIAKWGGHGALAPLRPPAAPAALRGLPDISPPRPPPDGCSTAADCDASAYGDRWQYCWKGVCNGLASHDYECDGHFHRFHGGLDPTCKNGCISGAGGCECLERGAPGWCKDGQVCDIHREIGFRHLHCQAPCDRPGQGRCPVGHQCGRDGLCELAPQPARPSECGANEDCSPGQWCVGDRQCAYYHCQPLECVDDWAHLTLRDGATVATPTGNHERSTALPVGTGAITDLRFCDEADDWFEYAAPADRDTVATILFPADANLSLSLHDHGWDALGTSDGLGGSERITIPAGAGSLLLKVGGLLGTVADYRLLIELGPP